MTIFFKTVTFNNFFSKNSNILNSTFLNLPSTVFTVNKPKLFKISLTIYNYSFYIPLDLIKNYCDFFNCDLIFTSNISEARFIIGLKSHVLDNQSVLQYAKMHRIPIYYLDIINYDLLNSFFIEILRTI